MLVVSTVEVVPELDHTGLVVGIDGKLVYFDKVVGVHVHSWSVFAMWREQVLGCVIQYPSHGQLLHIEFDLVVFSHSVVAGDVHELYCESQANVSRVVAFVDLIVDVGVVNELLDNMRGKGDFGEVCNVPDHVLQPLVESAFSFIRDEFFIIWGS